MSDSGYTPWREKVLEAWMYFTNRNYEIPEQLREGTAELDRFFAAHDAEVRANERKLFMGSAHCECDCVPDLGPSHCHACPGQTVWPCPVVTAQVRGADTNGDSELVEVYLGREDIDKLAHLLVQLSPATQRNAGATVRRLLREMDIHEAVDGSQSFSGTESEQIG